MPSCPSRACALPVHDPLSGRVVRAGFYRRRALPRKVQRYFCLNCRRGFSSQTLDPTYYQKRPDVNALARELFASSVSQRRSARILKVSLRTAVRKFRFVARQSAIQNELDQKDRLNMPVTNVQFDDLVTSIHTKCKPAALTLAVESGTRRILGFEVSDLPARHPLREVSLRKYGPRKDERPMGINRLFRRLVPLLVRDVQIRSDCDPEYPRHVRKHFPKARYERFLSRRGRTSGFGELKRGGHDPLYSLNHTCAMFRANLNRLVRRTWCTSKTKLGLILHAEIYVNYHNRELLPRSAI